MEEKISSSSKVINSKYKKKRPSIYTFLVLVFVVVLLIMGLFIGMKSLYFFIKYGKYTAKMNEYGFNLLYDNGKSTSGQSVTKSELVKVIIGSILNKQDISDSIVINNELAYDNEAWVKYAVMMNIIEDGKITKDNENMGITYKEAEVMIIKAVKNILNKDIESDDIYNTILKYKLNNHKYNKIKKGELNKLVITIVDYYSTLYYNADTSDNVNIVTDKDLLSSNYKEYPYILDNADKKIYEIPFTVENESKFESPNAEYAKRKDVYKQIDDVITNYFDAILNVSYQTITNKSLFNSIKPSLYYDYDESLVDTYVKYVKKHKIKLEGKCTVLLPIIYNTGEGIRIRVKIEFKMLNSDTDRNLLLPDILNNENIKYTDFEHEFYCDIPMGIILNALSLRVNTESLIHSVVSDNPTMKVIKGE